MSYESKKSEVIKRWKVAFAWIVVFSLQQSILLRKNLTSRKGYQVCLLPFLWKKSITWEDKMKNEVMVGKFLPLQIIIMCLPLSSFSSSCKGRNDSKQLIDTFKLPDKPLGQHLNTRSPKKATFLSLFLY